jgi:hypothetical protein
MPRLELAYSPKAELANIASLSQSCGADMRPFLLREDPANRSSEQKDRAHSWRQHARNEFPGHWSFFGFVSRPKRTAQEKQKEDSGTESKRKQGL